MAKITERDKARLNKMIVKQTYLNHENGKTKQVVLEKEKDIRGRK